MDGTISYFASAGDNQTVSTGPAVLEKIIFGKDVSSASIDISDSVDDGDGNVQLHFEGDTLMTSLGTVKVGAVFTKGITFNSTAQTNITFVWRTSN